jgi:hypothetical protein
VTAGCEARSHPLIPAGAGGKARQRKEKSFCPRWGKKDKKNFFSLKFSMEVFKFFSNFHLFFSFCSFY